jgi:hypothetical protein
LNNNIAIIIHNIKESIPRIELIVKYLAGWIRIKRKTAAFLIMMR